MSEITFCTTSKSGLGHLRRVTNIAKAIKARDGKLQIGLVTNATPAGLDCSEYSLYSRVDVVDRGNMCDTLAQRRGPVVIDTAVLPGIDHVNRPLCLILRQTKTERLSQFKLPGEREWDLVLVPNPHGVWQPDTEMVPAKRTEVVGWIYRKNNLPPPTILSRVPQILIASGGGGSKSHRVFQSEVARVLQLVRNGVACEVVQALGPRASSTARIDGVDCVLRVGPNLNEQFGRYDVVISTAGYNQILELACCDVPTLLVPIEATYDDQVERANRWQEHLGFVHKFDDFGSTVHWLVKSLIAGKKRKIVNLGRSGSEPAAQLISELVR